MVLHVESFVLHGRIDHLMLFYFLLSCSILKSVEFSTSETERDEIKPVCDKSLGSCGINGVSGNDNVAN